jgi:predicted dehydrogenase
MAVLSGAPAFVQNKPLFKLGLIGSGGRGTGALKNCLDACKILGVDAKVVAVADAFKDRTGGARGIGRVPASNVFVGWDSYKKLLETDIDIVIMATPPNFRPTHFAASIEAGKHVFMEKPVATDAPGVRRILAANEIAKQKGLLVAVGHHLRHETKHIEVVKRIHQGAIGKLCYLRAYFNSGGVWVRKRQPEQTEMQYQVRNWYYFTWLGGDHIVEQHVHDLDVCNWIHGEHPVEAQGMGGRQVRKGPDHGEIFDHHTVEFTYADGVKLFSFSRHMPGCWNSFSEHAHGSKGHASIDGHGTSELFVAGQEPRRWRRLQDGHQVEHDHLFAALLAGEPYNEGDYAASSTMTAILGRMATYSGKIVRWDEALASDLDLQPASYAWDATPPVLPGEDGFYPCAIPGVTRAW